MRRLVVAVAAAFALSLGCADSAVANLDADGFAFDGKTTYCEGVRDPKAPLIFEKELVASVGKCPIALEMTATIGNADPTEVSVDWSASLVSGDVAQSLFPRVVDATSGSPDPVIASLVRACKSGSNCAIDADVVVPAVVENDASATGPFDDDNHKTLRSYVFKFPDAAIDHIVVAKIVLPGDAQLNVSAIEFLAFQRVQSSGDGGVTGTVKPYEPTDANGGGFVGSEAALLTFKPTNASGSNANATGTGTEGALSTASTSKTGGKSNILLVSALSGGVCVVAIAYFAKRKKHGAPPLADESDLNSSIYRLTDIAKQVTSAQFSQQHQPMARSCMAPPSNQPFAERSSEIAPQPRAMALAHTDLTMSIERQTTSLNSLSDGSAFSAVPSDMTLFNSLGGSSVSETMSLSSLHHSEASDRSSFSGLHDSNVGLPDDPRSSPRVRRR